MAAFSLIIAIQIYSQLLYFVNTNNISTTTLVTNAPKTTYFASTNKNKDSDIFELCDTLMQYGCNPTNIPEIVELYINAYVGNYRLPTDPCYYNTINMTWIFSEIPDGEETLNTVSDDDDFQVIPCQILIQISHILQNRNIEYLIDYDYWFGNEPHCDSKNTSNNKYNITICPYFNASNITLPPHEECYDDNNCIFPFALTRYETSRLKSIGQCHCDLSCKIQIYSGDINALYSWSLTSSIVSLLLIIGYFINIFVDILYKKQKTKKWYKDLPLTFDITIIVAISLLLWIILSLLPFTVGKEHFVCETGYTAQLEDDKLPYSNISCFVQGSLIYISLQTIFSYFCLLIFVIWRTLYNPMKPLFGTHKKYFHLVTCLYIISYYIWFICYLEDGVIGKNAVLGVCGPTFIEEPYIYYFLWFPQLFTILIFIIFTPLSIYKICFTIQKNKTMYDIKKNSNVNLSVKNFDKDLLNLSIRLILYSIFLCCACFCILYAEYELKINEHKYEGIVTPYIECLLLSNYQENLQCQFDPDGVFPNVVLWGYGLFSLFATVSSFTLSCSNNKYIQWKYVQKRIAFKISNQLAATLSISKSMSAHEIEKETTKDISNIGATQTDTQTKKDVEMEKV